MAWRNGKGRDHSAGQSTLPKNCHPLVRRFYEELYHQRLTVSGVSRLSGVSDTTVRRWRGRYGPTLLNFQAALNVLGLELAIVPRGKQ